MSTDRASVIDALESAGRHPIEPIPPRLEALEERVMAAIDAVPDAAPGAVTIAPIVQRSRRRGSITRRVALGAVAASLIAVIVLAAGWFTTGDDPLVLAAADNVTVVLPDGSTIRGTAGLELPVGSEIEVTGSMVIADVSYGPGGYRVTDEGVIVIEPIGNPPRVTGDDRDGDEPTPVDGSTPVRQPPATDLATNTTRPPTTAEPTVVEPTTVDPTTRARVEPGDGNPGDRAEVPSSTRPPADEPNERDSERLVRRDNAQPSTTLAVDRPPTTPLASAPTTVSDPQPLRREP